MSGKCLHQRKISSLFDPLASKSTDASNFLEKHLQHCSDCQESLSNYQNRLQLVQEKIPHPICANDVILSLQNEVEELLNGIALVEQLEQSSRMRAGKGRFWREYATAFVATIVTKEIIGLGLFLSIFMIFYSYFVTGR